MKTHDINGLTSVMGEQPWFIQPEALGPWAEMVRASADTEGVQAAAGKKGDAVTGYHLEGSVAVVPIVGVLTKRPIFSMRGERLSTGYDEVRAAVRAAAAAPVAAAVLLDIESPGGQVDGVHEAGEDLAAIAQGKPVYTYANGLMASAAYWLGSVGRTIAAPATAAVGSIGVVMAHMDFSVMLDRVGIKVTYLHAGAYKVMGNDSEPLSVEARAYFQERLDHLYGLFVTAVMSNRGVTYSKVLPMTDGKVFIGEQAKKIGLIDAVMSRDDFVSKIQEDPQMPSVNKNTAAAPVRAAAFSAPGSRPGGTPATVPNRPAQAGPVPAKGAGSNAAPEVLAVRERILQAAAKVAGPEKAARLRTLVASGVTVEQYNAMAEIVGQAPDGKKWPKLVNAYAAKHDCSKADAMHAVDLMHPGLRERYLGIDDSSAKAAAAAVHPFTRKLHIYQAEHRCTASEALDAVVEANPAAHDQFLQDMTGYAGKRKAPKPDAEHKFLRLSRAHAEQHGCGISEAQLAVDKANPGLREQFLQACAKR
ncbi:MAG: S49 family peptidase [Pseudomonadota bacterium]